MSQKCPCCGEEAITSHPHTEEGAEQGQIPKDAETYCIAVDPESELLAEAEVFWHA